MGTSKFVVLLGVVVVALTIGGCATPPEPFEYHPDNQLKQGPGLFSGEDGAFTIYRKPLESEAPHPPAPDNEQPEGDGKAVDDP